MGEHESQLTAPRRYRPPGRGQLWLRRVVGAVVAAGVLGAAGWAGASLLRNESSSPPPPTETEPPLERLRVIFPEGFTRDEMADRVAAVREIAIERRGVTPRLTKSGYLRASASAVPPPAFRKDWGGRSIEGFLFPATYEFSQHTSSAGLVRDQLAHFREQWRTVSLRYARSKNLTPYDVLVIASMVEKEAAVAAERRLVSAVIYNRLRVGMPLGIDATIRYGRGVPGTEPLKRSDLESDNPYNTRRRLGLPPTPIANPGRASIRAAANPARVDYLFFVRRPNSLRHFFTASESEFLRKKCEFGFGC
ncbi:MAG TPA: endolytic transglycosylase MltG [Gaiellaceae bacterium]|nr:endolytic transglycosylase MltG [Gaiellaceae bacterium]